MVVMGEVPLVGGYTNVVVRVGDTVRRRMPERGQFIHDLLMLLADHDWPGAPRWLGVDTQGRQVLTYIEGWVPWSDDRLDIVQSEANLAATGHLIRQFHDITANSSLAGDGEVVCHYDLSPKNTVYRDDDSWPQPFAFIDWDCAAPGPALHDFAYACWQFLKIGSPTSDLAALARRILVMCEGYGLQDRHDLIDAVLYTQEACWRSIVADAAVGIPHAVRLQNMHVVKKMAAQQSWTAEHRSALVRALA